MNENINSVESAAATKNNSAGNRPSSAALFRLSALMTELISLLFARLVRNCYNEGLGLFLCLVAKSLVTRLLHRGLNEA